MTTHSISSRKYNSARPRFLLLSSTIVLFLASTALAAAFGSGTKFEEAFEMEKEISGDRVTIKHSHGNIKVHGWDRPGLKIAGTKIVRALDGEKAESFAKSMEVRITENRGEIMIETVRPKGLKTWSIREHLIHYELFIPSSLPVELDSEHGNVLLTQFREGVSVEAEHGGLSIEEIGNYLEVDHEHGNVSIAGVEGAMEIKAEHGNLDIQAVMGSLEVKHGHGKVVLDGIDGEVDAKFEHGKVDVTDVHGSLDLKHEHGRVSLKGIHGDLRVKKEHGTLAVEGVDGGVEIDVEHADTRIHASDAISSSYEIDGEHSDIRLLVPNANEASYALKTEHGRIHTDLPITISKGKDWQAATSQEGNPNIVISTEHGDISIE